MGRALNLGCAARWALLLLVGVCQFAHGAGTSPDADQAWQVILEQAGGPGTRFANQADALAAAKAHLEKQETALRDFSRHFPADPRQYSAQIRLAAVLAARSRMTGPPSLRTDAQKILVDLETNGAVPPSVQADAAYARVTLSMENAAGKTDPATRDALLRDVRSFDAAHPADRRYAGLLAEVATLYDADPALKGPMLTEAAMRATDDTLRKRLADDLKRLALLGHPLAGSLQPWNGGGPVALGTANGRVTVLLFWASWSLPALHELAVLEKVAPAFQAQPVEFLTVSLDQDRAMFAGTVKAANLTWPTQCDFRGWEGELVRSFGINTLPTVWILDRSGNLTTLNARGQEAELIRAALAKP